MVYNVDPVAEAVGPFADLAEGGDESPRAVSGLSVPESSCTATRAITASSSTEITARCTGLTRANSAGPLAEVAVMSLPTADFGDPIVGWLSRNRSSDTSNAGPARRCGARNCRAAAAGTGAEARQSSCILLD